MAVSQQAAWRCIAAAPPIMAMNLPLPPPRPRRRPLGRPCLTSVPLHPMLRIDDARQDADSLQKQEQQAGQTRRREPQNTSNPEDDESEDFASLKANAWRRVSPEQINEHLAALRSKAERLQHPHKAPEVKPSRILHYHCDHLGTPRELTDDDGKLVWSADYWAWGKVNTSEVPAAAPARRSPVRMRRAGSSGTHDHSRAGPTNYRSGWPTTRAMCRSGDN